MLVLKIEYWFIIFFLLKIFGRIWICYIYVVLSEFVVVVGIVFGVGCFFFSLDIEKLMFLNLVGFIMKDIVFIGWYCLENWEKLEKLWENVSKFI